MHWIGQANSKAECEIRPEESNARSNGEGSKTRFLLEYGIFYGKLIILQRIHTTQSATFLPGAVLPPDCMLIIAGGSAQPRHGQMLWQH